MLRLAFGVCTICILTLFGCSQPKTPDDASAPALVGAWRAKIQFTNGAFASITDLEFMYVFNFGGTMTESSNYDAAPPVPPAYGTWKAIGKRQFVAHYEFYMTRPPDSSDHAPAGSGWLPAGHGVLVDTISVTDDGQAFSSRIHFQAFDRTGKPVEGGGEASGQGVKIR